MLTKKQKKVLDYIKSYKSTNKLAPSLEEIKNQFKLSSVSTAHHYIKKLQEAGCLYKDYNHPRSVSPIEDKQTLKIPLLGSIAAGQPIEAIENNGETITITKDEVSNHGNYYALRVNGNSMIDEGIFDGDIVVIRKQELADNGQTVVAILNDNEATLKKLYREKNQFRLQPANPTLFPIYTNNLEIRGVVVKIIRNLDLPTEKEMSRDEKFKRRIDYTWDFQGEKTKPYTHGLHSYPAMFIPQVARRLLQNYSQIGDTICDIFCGSGTSLIESRLLGRKAYGIDLNPHAIFLAKVKTTEINPMILSKEYFSLLDKIRQINDSEVKRPAFFNLDFWFKENVIVQLSKIKMAIEMIEDKILKNFFLVSFSETVRLASNTKNGEFKLVRISKDKLADYNPDVLSIFRRKTEFNIAGMSDYFHSVVKNTWAKPIYGDSSQDIGIKEKLIDCIITSPPYGDSRTTVAYGQFSRLSAQWVGLFKNPDEASGVDNELLGGKNYKTLKNNLSSNYLNDVLEKILKKDEKRAQEVLSFFIDLNNCLIQAYKILKPKKYFCLVIGNRQVKQIRIPTDFILAELGEKIGFTCEDIIVRNIPGKRMPSKNSPTNITGELEETMNKESIVILRKS